MTNPYPRARGICHCDRPHSGLVGAGGQLRLLPAVFLERGPCWFLFLPADSVCFYLKGPLRVRGCLGGCPGRTRTLWFPMLL